MFQDRVKIYVEGGAGGSGSVSFRREAHVPRGGPDGGDGGHGGDVVLVADSSRRDLSALRFSPHRRAGRGGHGQGKLRHGARGADDVILVPPGTQVAGLEGRAYDLIEPAQRAVVAAGGLGGHGNKRFTSSTHQAPRFAERGLPGESGWIELRLKLLADVGLIGLPNAGKSSLLNRLTRAAPKVADYPFTTLEPVLGTIDDGERQLVLADIPGLIEGAAEGAGLGHEFLAHVERCRMLVHLVAVDPFGEQDPLLAYDTVRVELEQYGAGLSELPEIIAVSKLDLAEEGEAELIAAELEARTAGRPEAILAISSATGTGLDQLTGRIFAITPEPVAALGAIEAAGGDAPRFEAEHIVYTPSGNQGFEVIREGEAFRVLGRGVEMLIARHDITNLEALAYLERRLREIGVLAALERAGFEPGGEVRIGDHEFELE